MPPRHPPPALRHPATGATRHADRNAPGPSLQALAYRVLLVAGFEGPPSVDAFQELLEYANMAVEINERAKDYAQLGGALLYVGQVCRLFGRDDLAYGVFNTAYHCFAKQCRLPRFKPQTAAQHLRISQGLYVALHYKQRLHLNKAKSRLPQLTVDETVSNLWACAASLAELGDETALLLAHREAVGYLVDLEHGRGIDIAHRHLSEMQKLEAASPLNLEYHLNTFTRAEIELFLAAGELDRAVEAIETKYAPHSHGHSYYEGQLLRWRKKLAISQSSVTRYDRILYGSPALIFNL